MSIKVSTTGEVLPSSSSARDGLFLVVEGIRYGMGYGRDIMSIVH